MLNPSDVTGPQVAAVTAAEGDRGGGQRVNSIQFNPVRSNAIAFNVLLAGALATGWRRWIQATYITSAATFSGRADCHPPQGIRTAPNPFLLFTRLHSSASFSLVSNPSPFNLFLKLQSNQFPPPVNPLIRQPINRPILILFFDFIIHYFVDPFEG